MDLQRDAFHRTIGTLERLGDLELLDAYKAYVARLTTTIGAGWLDTYASMYQRDRRQLSGQTAGLLVTPEELAVRDRAAADPELTELFQGYIALLDRKNLLDQRYMS
jgi:hypothetical protein